MSTLYPTLEDMKVGELLDAQRKFEQPAQAALQPSAIQSVPSNNSSVVSMYPSLTTWMGLDLATLPVSSSDPRANAVVVAPVSSQNAIGIKRAEIKPGIRKITLCKDARGKIGLTVKDINKGVFVAVVCANTPAAMAGLRFGDQILEVNSQTVAGYSSDKAANFLKKCKGDKIEMVIRDRPFERTITLNKDSNGYVGFCFKKGKIISLVKDSSAARNGLLTEHQLVEVDGRNVVGLTDKEIQVVVDSSPRTVTVTIMPTVLYDHMVKCIGASELRKYMDHSVPDV